MDRLDTQFLKEMLQQIKEGDRFGLSTDLFAHIFPPGHQDEAALAEAARFAAMLRCEMDYWPATNEVFFTKSFGHPMGHARGGPGKNRLVRAR
jgi:hypothetical protein